MNKKRNLTTLKEESSVFQTIIISLVGIYSGYS